MALEASAGTPLNRMPAVDRSEAGQSIQHAKEVPQRANRWCWAASIESARLTLGKGGREQHLIVADHLSCGRERCDVQPRHKKCDRTIDRGELQCLWRKEGFGKASYQQQTIAFPAVKNEIAAGRLVLLEINNRHVILVYGWEVDSLGVEIIHVLDTLPGAPEWSNFKDLLFDYDSWGPWKGTCLGLEFDGSESC